MKVLPLTLFLTLAVLRSAPAEVSGTFSGQGKPARLAFVSTLQGREIAGRATLTLIFTEKDHTKDENPEAEASFKTYGSALIVTIFAQTGQVLACNVAHTANAKLPFGSAGSLKMTEYQNKGGALSGHLATAGPVAHLGQIWEADLTFKTKTPGAPLK